MSPIYTPGKVVLRKTWQPMDADAAAYITAVETADGQALEERTKIAIDNFVLGCKADGIWSAIKASCILAGARTLAGALVPLVGTAPTNVGGLFVSGDYNRKTGLVGNGSTKYLDSNRANNADPQNSKHLSIYMTTYVANISFAGSSLASGSSQLVDTVGNGLAGGRANSASTASSALPLAVGLFGISRSDPSNIVIRSGSRQASVANATNAPSAQSISIFRRTGDVGTSSRLAFYSIGESLDLALLDARVTDLINAFGVAIP
jgi:hypothetical protein